MLASSLMGIGAMGGVAVEIFGDGDLGGQFAPGFGDFNVFLAKQGFATVVGDLRGAVVPFNFVKRGNLRRREAGLEGEA